MTTTRSRRSFLKTSLGGAVAVAGGAIAAGPALAQKAPKASVAYQETPKNGQDCEGCMFYVAGTEGEPGACQIVQGEIAPQAWCNLWGAK
ncbi:hypothetical protein CKO28_02865 [Rhodovibrio sodomensis]|uniref:High potential iron-sulfur proteins family profile domain-containing protein n=1 Tax=Rhodovibrio sodomensis TaxID=1088 RepID=A0ABS1D993_9PROT|nr:high-potential iron-sulfur protein [Rhodovibrio sodomensis]MBK1666984.1 hypothetical protein [Rhodovibrio sodomensis]